MASNEAILKLLLVGVDKGASKVMKGVGDETARTGTGLSKFKAVAGAALLAVGTAAAAYGKKSVNAYKEAAQEASGLSRVTGLTIADSSRLRFAAEETGVGYATLSTSVRLFGKNLMGAQSSQKKMADLTKQLGFEVADAHGKLLPMSDLLPKVADRFKSMPDGPQKTALAMKLFGRSGADMIKLLNKGSEGLDEFAKESDKTGNTLSNIDGFKKNLQAQREFHAAMKGLQIQIGQALMPVILFLSEFLVQHVAPAFTRVSGYVATHKDLLSTVGKVVAATAVAFALLTVAAKAQAASILIAEVGMKGYLLQTKIGAALGKAFAAAQWLVNAAMSANPLALVVLALVGLGVALVMAYKKSETFRNIVQGVFRAVSTAAQNTIGWVKSHWPLLLAILLGPFALAALAIGKNWDKIKSGGQSVLDFVKGMPHKISGFFSGIWSGLANGLKSAINAVLHLPITIPKINTHIPGVGTVGGQTLIPALAKGGIVTRPTLALIGEAGPEAVVPLSRFNGGRSGGGDVVRITINGAMDPKAVAAQIETMLANLKRTSRGGGKLAFQ